MCFAHRREGRDIVIADVLETMGAAVVEEVRALGHEGLFVRTDVSDEAAVKAVVERTMETFGRLDILVCCAGVLGLEAPFFEQSPAHFDEVMKINLYGVYYAHQAAIPHMLSRGWGRCVTIGSMAARNGAPNSVPYAVSKGAVTTLIRSLGAPFARQGVFVNGVEPGRILTDMVVPRCSAEHLADPGNPLARYADPEEVAEVVEFLCSERNSYTTGSVWSVNGAED